VGQMESIRVVGFGVSASIDNKFLFFSTLSMMHEDPPQSNEYPESVRRSRKGRASRTNSNLLSNCHHGRVHVQAT
jgi:hypothetical protein